MPFLKLFMDLHAMYHDSPMGDLRSHVWILTIFAVGRSKTKQQSKQIFRNKQNTLHNMKLVQTICGVTMVAVTVASAAVKNLRSSSNSTVTSATSLASSLNLKVHPRYRATVVGPKGELKVGVIKKAYDPCDGFVCGVQKGCSPIYLNQRRSPFPFKKEMVGKVIPGTYGSCGYLYGPVRYALGRAGKEAVAQYEAKMGGNWTVLKNDEAWPESSCSETARHTAENCPLGLLNPGCHAQIAIMCGMQGCKADCGNKNSFCHQHDMLSC
mmetsp:Transcript_36459/g.58695  ORF Transcript_36459/g.58695 Transcript_36459/m.58695 type:complete len:268 (-) Transcript_36459:114-917(-)